MPKLPVLKPQEVVARLEALGFVEVRQRGAHAGSVPGVIDRVGNQISSEVLFEQPPHVRLYLAN